MQPVSKVSFFFLVLFLYAAWVQSEEIPAPKFTNSSKEFADAGHIKLLWQSELDLGNTTFLLQQSEDSAFHISKVLYEGPDLATFVSGLSDGNYYFRIKAITENQQSNWSEPMMVRVQHHTLNMAFTLFGIGAVVFLLTCFVVIKGSRQMIND